MQEALLENVSRSICMLLFRMGTSLPVPSSIESVKTWMCRGLTNIRMHRRGSWFRVGTPSYGVFMQVQSCG